MDGSENREEEFIWGQPLRRQYLEEAGLPHNVKLTRKERGRLRRLGVNPDEFRQHLQQVVIDLRGAAERKDPFTASAAGRSAQSRSGGDPDRAEKIFDVVTDIFRRVSGKDDDS